LTRLFFESIGGSGSHIDDDLILLFRLRLPWRDVPSSDGVMKVVTNYENRVIEVIGNYSSDSALPCARGPVTMITEPEIAAIS
jgi:hypothetical protein